MDLFTDANVVGGLFFLVLTATSSLIGVLAWLGNKMYDKLQIIEALFIEKISSIADRFTEVEVRLVRVEAQVENIRERCSDSHHPHRDHNDYIS